MIIDIIDKYSKIIKGYDILKFSMTETTYCLIYEIILINNTHLFARDYLFQNGSRKYSFHWQDEEGNCIVRWDNAPHHNEVSTFPYHKHIGKNEDIIESQPVKLEKVLEHIRNEIVRIAVQQTHMKSKTNF